MISGRFWSVLSPSCFPDSFWMSFCLLITPDPLDIHQEMHIIHTLFFCIFSLFPCFFSFGCLIFFFFLAFHLPVVLGIPGFSCFRDDFPDDSDDFMMILWILGAFWDDLAFRIHDFRRYFDDFESFLMIFMDFQDFKSFLMSDMCLYECYGMFQDKLWSDYECFYMCLPRFALIYNVLKPSAAVSQSFIIKRKSESCVAPPVCFSRAKSVEPVTSSVQ